MITRTQLLLLFAFLCMTASVEAQTLAFPGAMGYGKYSRGGRGGKVIYVANLNSTGPGSLAAACEAQGPRTVVFRVGGQIVVGDETRIIIDNPCLTIAGETAPGDGIVITGDDTLKKTPLVIQADHVVVRHIRIRPGPGTPRNSPDYTGTGIDCLNMTGSDCIVDRCSLSFSTDELCSATGSRAKGTFQRCIMSYPLHYSTHYYGYDKEAGKPTQEPVNHGRGPLFYGNGRGGKRVDDFFIQVSFCQNLVAHATYRYPAFKGGGFHVVNNINYNYKWRPTMTSGLAYADVIGNLYKPGPNTAKANRQGAPKIWTGITIFPEPFKFKNTKVYVRENISPTRTRDDQPQWDVVSADKDVRDNVKSDVPVTEPVEVMPVRDLAERLLPIIGAGAGMSPNRLDEIDRKTLSDFEQRKGQFIDHPTELCPDWPNVNFKGGTPYPDEDQDGMDDHWEKKHGGDLDGNGFELDRQGRYTNLEKFLHELAGDEETKLPQSYSLGDPCAVVTKFVNPDLDELFRKRDVLFESSMKTSESIGAFEVKDAGKVEYRDGWMRLTSSKDTVSDICLPIDRFSGEPNRWVAEWEMQNVGTKSATCRIFVRSNGQQGEGLSFTKELSLEPARVKRIRLVKNYTMILVYVGEDMMGRRKNNEKRKIDNIGIHQTEDTCFQYRNFNVYSW